MGNRPYLFIFFFLAALVVSGCASQKDGLDKEISYLRSSIDETNQRVDELNNRFLLLQEKLDVSRAGEAGRYQDEASVQAAQPPMTTTPDTPPHGLKVVELTEESRPIKKPKASVSQSPVERYNSGQDLFLAGRYDEARGVFLDFIERFPGHNLADNALYWLGESYYADKDFSKAIGFFKTIIEKYAGENKAPDAYLKLGFSYAELKDSVRAREHLEELTRRHPDSAAATKARAALKKIRTP